MPPLSRRFLATAALCLLAGVGLGFALLVQREAGGRWPGPLAISAHAHLILVGAMLEAIFGTAIWLFPRPIRGHWQAPGWVGEVAWVLLTAGTAARAAGELLRSPASGVVLRDAIITGGAMQVIGIAAAIVMLLPRVRASAARTG